MKLQRVVEDFARGLMTADSRRPQCKTYLPGIGPHEEPAVARLVLSEMRLADPGVYGDAKLEVPYDSRDAVCDLCLPGQTPSASPWAWAIELKAARTLRNNGQVAEEAVKHLVSPFAEDRSALSDCEKVLGFGNAQRRALLLYGYDYPTRPLGALVDMLDVLIPRRVVVEERAEAPFAGLIHPRHQRGVVIAWAVRSTPRAP